MGYICLLLLYLSFYGISSSSPQSAVRLQGAVGGAVSLPAPVLDSGFLRYNVNVALVFKRVFIELNVTRFRGRVTWNSSTGHFHITQLNTQDSGEYRVQNTEGNVSDTTVFQLTVYNNVSKPQVSSETQVSAGSCPFLCSVANGREVTLSWYREGEEKPLNHSSSPDLNTNLTLPLETEGLSHSYSCVATNPVSTERVTVNTEEHCLGPVSSPQVSSVTQASAGNCTLLCSVSNGRNVTLSWYRDTDNKTLKHTSSPDPNTLTVPLDIPDLSVSYSCVATNRLSTERVPVHPEEHCFTNVSKPQVSNKNQVSAGSCPFLCSVSNGRELTLSWYREGEEKPLNHTSSPDLNTNLTLPLETEGLSHSYSCVATNPISTERVTVNPGEHCLGSIPLVAKIALVFLGILILTGIFSVYFLKRRRDQQKEDSPQEITYATVIAKPRADRSKKKGNSQGNETDHGKTPTSCDDIVYASISHSHPHSQACRSARSKNMENDEYCIYAGVQT
ncbi:Fc receptor-like protein 2 isoform X2 [Amia ocellicauda]|uniref:Fc receptor-like protein 2 isoform X2 n=1 Tax=Amia ocellicauda TaxID=2972642 RepID=UPI003464A221